MRENEPRPLQAMATVIILSSQVYPSKKAAFNSQWHLSLAHTLIWFFAQILWQKAACRRPWSINCFLILTTISSRSHSIWQTLHPISLPLSAIAVSYSKEDKNNNNLSLSPQCHLNSLINATQSSISSYVDIPCGIVHIKNNHRQQITHDFTWPFVCAQVFP